ncbi:glutaminase [Lophium mytilinum]|uniref:Glutaminase n=1 Tax=Lophium mytilinum TaxID=390894 RepID=A0A6A6R253_9PEZI|nr:glutaminase [Lophium mytilinum]
MGLTRAVISSILTIITTILALACASPTFSPIQPPSYPLAVRSPYLSVWLPGNLATNLPTAVPEFWTGQKLGWSILARVEENNKWTTYSLFGFGGGDANVVAATVVSGEYTTTRSTFVLTAGAAKFSLEFFSPVDPKNYVRQSLPFSYFTVTVASSKGVPVQVYSAIDKSFTGNFDANPQISLTQTTSGKTSIYEWTPSKPQVFVEKNNAAQWGTVVFASRQSDGSKSFTYSAGQRDTIRGQFVNFGKLSNASTTVAADTITAYAHDLGNVTSAACVTFAIGHYHEDAINYLGAHRTPYFRSVYPNSVSALIHFLDDHSSARADSLAFENKLHDLAIDAGGEKYRDILALTVRQVFGAIELTIPGGATPTDTDDVLVFMKEISSNGDINTLDVIFPAIPLFYVLAPEYIRLLLEPELRYLKNGGPNQAFPVHDLGTYPNATGHDNGNEEHMPVEASSVVLIASLWYAKATGNSIWSGSGGTFTSTLTKYADFLSDENNGLYLPSQLSTIDGPGPLAGQTNLAIKSAVALNAFGVLSGIKKYSDRGLYYASQLYNSSGTGIGQSCGDAAPHFTLQTTDVHDCADYAFSTAFNLYPDVLLGLKTFPQSAVDMEDAFYPTARKEAGVQADTRGDWMSTFWGFWAAASGEEGGATEKQYINDVYAFISNGKNTHPFCDRVHVTGDSVGLEYTWRARPVTGGHFAVLARKKGPDLIWK